MRNKKSILKIVVFAIVLTCSIGFLPSLTTMQNKTVVTVEAATRGEKNALSSAKDYLSVMPFSEKGLVEQLKYDGYSTKEATYAAEHCGANWKKQAVKAAKNYLDTMSFSKSALIEQLVFDGFTKSEAKYGVSKAYK